MPLPQFGIEAYDELLGRLRAAGCAFAPIADLPTLSPERTVLLRHDVDLDPPSTLPMAECEARRGIVATYYMPLTQHFNALDPVHRDAIRTLRSLGHDVGLHYDMRTYPAGEQAARAHLDWELGILTEIVGAPVRTLCMHQPHRGHPDPFRSLPGLVHPHDPSLQQDMVYVSDSCRAWGDADALRNVLDGEPPYRLLLNLHPELWLDAAVADPLDYLERVVRPRCLARTGDAIDAEVSAWRGHRSAREPV